MKIAYTLAPGRGETNLVLAEFAAALAERGLRLCGTVQVDTEREAQHHCDMDVQVLPNGPLIRISQNLGPQSRGCRLDPAQLEQAVALSNQALEHGADLLLVNKFGKHEAEGRGFRETIARALELDIPVLVGANKLNLEALKDFVGGEIVEVPAELDALKAWIDDTHLDKEDLSAVG